MKIFILLRLHEVWKMFNNVNRSGMAKSRVSGRRAGVKGWSRVQNINGFCARRLSVERYSYSDVAGWLGGWVAGWVSVTLRYCIKTAKPIGKLFRPSESPIILVF